MQKTNGCTTINEMEKQSIGRSLAASINRRIVQVSINLCCFELIVRNIVMFTIYFFTKCSRKIDLSTGLFILFKDVQ